MIIYLFIRYKLRFSCAQDTQVGTQAQRWQPHSEEVGHDRQSQLLSQAPVLASFLQPRSLVLLTSSRVLVSPSEGKCEDAAAEGHPPFSCWPGALRRDTGAGVTGTGWTTRPISDRGQNNKVSLTELY